MARDLFLAIHIAGGSTGLALGPVAMWAGKRRGLHTRVGEAYHWAMFATCAAALVLAALDFSRIWWLGLIAIFSYSFALRGYLAAKRRPRGWLIAHISGQGGSYIALVTALLVVNLGGPLIIWFVPTIVGSPIIAWVIRQVEIGHRPKAAIPASQTMHAL